MATTVIDQYEVMYSSNRSFPRIWLKSGGNFIGQLIFQPNGSQLPPDGTSPGGQVNLFYHLDDFAHAIDLLRNEKPMHLLYNGPTSENGIKTTAEAVSEEEA